MQTSDNFSHAKTFCRLCSSNDASVTCTHNILLTKLVKFMTLPVAVIGRGRGATGSQFWPSPYYCGDICIATS